MSASLRIILAQYDFLLGAVNDNARRMMEMIHRARDQAHADLVVFPELAISGCPPQDLLRQAAWMAQCRAALDALTQATTGIVAVVGWPEAVDGRCYNTLSVLRDGNIAANWRKRTLCDDLGLNESRYFHAAGDDQAACVVEVAGVRVGVLGGHDLTAPTALQAVMTAGAELLLAPAAWPFDRAEPARREALVSRCAHATGIPIICLNAVGAQDALVFDGMSRWADGQGQVYPASIMFSEQWIMADYLPTRQTLTLHTQADADDAGDEARLWCALTRAIADYCRKNGFSRTWLGLSGGLDSALVLALAVDALGAEHITAVRMPSRHTSELSNDLAQAQCDALGVRLLTLPIERPFQGFLDTLADTFQGQPVDTTEENLQSRIRGSLMMALTNKFGGLLLCTGNKSECAVGYATIYGDMCGGYAPICDVYKTEVYALARWRNRQSPQPVIPLEVIARPPSAELRPDQRDQDSLPAYDVLDAILYRHLEQDASAAEIVAAGFDPPTVERVLHLVRASEWKRHQAAPGPKVSTRAFAIDRHYPISRGD